MRKNNKVVLGLGIALFSTILVACGSGNATGNGVKEGEEVKLNTESQFPIIAEGEELTLSIMGPGMGEA